MREGLLRVTEGRLGDLVRVEDGLQEREDEGIREMDVCMGMDMCVWFGN